MGYSDDFLNKLILSDIFDNISVKYVEYKKDFKPILKSLVKSKNMELFWTVFSNIEMGSDYSAVIFLERIFFNLDLKSLKNIKTWQDIFNYAVKTDYSGFIFNSFSDFQPANIQSMSTADIIEILKDVFFSWCRYGKRQVYIFSSGTDFGIFYNMPLNPKPLRYVYSKLPPMSGYEEFCNLNHIFPECIRS